MPDEEFDLLAALGNNEPESHDTFTGKKFPPEEILEIHEDGIVTPGVADEIAEVTPELIAKIEERMKDPKAECLRQIINILSEHDGLESNIPITHEYWKLTNKYRTM